MKSDGKTLVTFEIENDLYFNMLQLCVDERISIDEFVEKALRHFIDTYGKKKKPSKRK
jgi:hypothetical protein